MLAVRASEKTLLVCGLVPAILPATMRVDAAEAEGADGGATRCMLSRRCHDSPLLRMRKGDASKSRPGAGVVKLAVGGNISAWKADSTLATPAAPAAVNRWPTVDFTEPITHCPGRQPAEPHERFETLKLDGVAYRSAGGVALDEIDVARRPARFAVSGVHGP